MGLFAKVLPTSTVASTFAGFPPDMDDWSCAQWKAYYQNNVATQGKAKALQIIDVDSENVGMFASVHYCEYDCEWVSYFAKEGLNVNNIFSTVYCGTTSVVKSAVNTAVNTAKTVDNVTGAASSFTSSKLLIGVGVLAVGLIAYKVISSDSLKQNIKYLV